MSRRLPLLAASIALLALTAYLAWQVRGGPHTAAPGPLDAAGRAPRGPEPMAAAVAEPASPPAAPPTAASSDEPGLASAPPRPTAPVALEELTPPAQPLAAQIAASANLGFDEANRLYDRHEYDEARSLALALLRDAPGAVRMRRIVVSASCIMGDLEVAQTHYLALPARDRADMRRRCAQYGAAFRE